MQITEQADIIFKAMQQWQGKKLDRNYKVLRLLKILDITALENNFESVYIHTLIEYTVDVTPLDLVYFFAAKDIKDSFETGLYKDPNEDFFNIIKQQFQSNPRLHPLVNRFPFPQDLKQEIITFVQHYDYFTFSSASPFTLKKYNEDNAFKLEMLEEKETKSLDFKFESQPLALPLDVQSFNKLMDSHFLYVDKTEFIAQLINTKLTYFFLSRPRRFGKSLLISTMKEVFSGRKELFKDLKIYDQIDWQTYPVIYFDFTLIATNTSISVEKALADEMDKITRSFDLPVSEGAAKNKFRLLIENLSLQHKKPVVILIDEYDKFIIDHITNEKQRENNRSELKEFFSILKGMGDFLRFVFITGVSRFTRVSIFSDLNNLIDITFDSQYAAIAGYTESELLHYFSGYIQRFALREDTPFTDLLNIIRVWYNGYSWDGITRVYNPFSILRLFNSFEFKDHWFATGTPTFLLKAIREQKLGIQELDDIHVNKSKLENMEVGKLELIPLLFQTGYLTIIEKIKKDISTVEFLVGYPNREVRYSFLNHLLADFSPENPRLIDHITEAIQANQLDEALNTMKAIFADVPATIFDYKKESSYHALMHVIFLLILDKTGSEIPTNRGRMDHVIEMEHYIYIFEFKMESTGKALKQIFDRKYYEKYILKRKTIVLVGVSFSKEERNIKEWVIELLEDK